MTQGAIVQLTLLWTLYPWPWKCPGFKTPGSSLTNTAS